jgi:ribosomal protein L19E
MLILGKSIRKLFRDGLIMKKQVHLHSRARLNKILAAKKKGELFVNDSEN